MTVQKTKTIRRPNTSSPKRITKAATIINMLRRKSGASLEELGKATGWQNHSLRGFLSGTLKKRMGLEVQAEKNARGIRRYRIPTTAKA